MTKTIQMTAEVPESREIRIVLPSEIPSGPAQLILSIQSPPEPSPSKLGDILQTGFFGLWRHRADLPDSLEFAHQLRTDSWRRGL